MYVYVTRDALSLYYETGQIEEALCDCYNEVVIYAIYKIRDNNSENAAQLIQFLSLFLSTDYIKKGKQNQNIICIVC
jgi:hypothetical protein